IAGDNIMPAKSIAAILHKLGEADIVMPYLTDARHRGLVRWIGSLGFVWLVNLLFGHRVRYYNGMLPRREVLLAIEVQSDGYFMQAEAVVKMLGRGATYVEVGVSGGHAAASSGSHALRLKNLQRLLGDLVRTLVQTRFGG
ncbi:MAG: hypothetical protein ACYCW6_20595, partial [Candidatus Xenobia bacterium]